MYITDGSSKDYSNVVDSYGQIAKNLVEKNLPIEEYEKIIDSSSSLVSRRYKNIYMWGWLGKKVESNGIKPLALKNKIIKKIAAIPDKNVVDHYCGYHTCEICGDFLFEGSIKIRYNDKVYCCPKGVQHYIKEHDYNPPKEAIEAIMEGEVITPAMMVHELVAIGKNSILNLMKKKRKEIAIRKEDEERRKECQERIDKLWSPNQKKLISESVNGGGDFVSLKEN